jgi:hypothetical protein
MRLWQLGSFAALSFTLSMAQSISADTLNYSIHQDYISPRAIGMGNAFVAVADDYNALFYNPAGLARLKTGQLNLKIQAGGSPAIIDLGKQLQDADKADDKTTAYADVLNKNFGNNYWFRFPNVGGTWARPGWALSFIPLDLSAELAIHQNLGPTLVAEAYQDSTLAYGYANSFNTDNVFSAGATVKAVHRAYGYKAVNSSELVINDKYFSPEDAKEGLTFDVDLGVLWSPKVPEKGWLSWTKYAKPTFGLTGRNLIDYGFKSNLHLLNKESGEPPKLIRRGDVGTMWEFPSFWVFQPRFAFDVRDIGHPYWTFKKGLHTGIELLWNVAWWLQGGYRVGLNQGYLTLGFSAQFTWFRLDLSTYGEEIGTANSPLENRRYIVQMSLDF